MENSKIEDIKGWGSDLDVNNRPGHPMWKRPIEGTGAHWETPEKQKQKVKVFHSIERSDLTSVFGTSIPPKGLSGLIRTKAFQYSEGSWAHWFILILADRINVLEGVGEDLLKLRFPNILAEMGVKSELRYNRKGFSKKVMLGSLLLTIPLFLVLKKRT